MVKANSIICGALALAQLTDVTHGTNLNSGGDAGILISGGDADMSSEPAGSKQADFQQGKAYVTTVLPDLYTGIAMSGGGSRSATSAMGQYRALGKLVEKFDSISSVSGGTWASSIFMFAEGSNEYLLGAKTVPSFLNRTALDEAPGALGAVLTAKTEKIAAKITAKKYALGGGKITKLDIHQLWQETVGQAFLNPFKLDTNQYLAQDTKSASVIIDNNPGLGLSESDFLVPRTDRPQEYIMGSTLLAPRGYHATQETVGYMHYTPSYSGVAAGPITNEYPETLSKDDVYYRNDQNLSSPVVVGGGLIETFAFGSAPPSEANLPLDLGNSADSSTVEVSVGVPTGKNNKFTLADATGASSAAFASATAQTNLTSHVDPSIQYWSPLMNNEEQACEDMMLGDGGNSEDTGVVVLLQRKTQRIASFINTDFPLDMSIDLCDPVHYSNGSSFLQGKVTGQLVGLFQGYAPYKEFGALYTNDNAVFAHDALQQLLCAGQTLVRQGKPFVVKDTYQVMPNARWGIEGGWNVTVVWNLLTVVRNFEESLPLETQQEIALGENGTLANFPYFKTMYQNGDEATAYTYPQINLLAAQQQYAVEQNLDLYAGLLDSDVRDPDDDLNGSPTVAPTPTPTTSSAALSAKAHIVILLLTTWSQLSMSFVNL